jgi:hypothetical protein
LLVFDERSALPYAQLEEERFEFIQHLLVLPSSRRSLLRVPYRRS